MATKSLNIILLFAVLFSSTGFVWGEHTCKMMEKVQADVKNCCASHESCDDDCCQTDFQYFQLDQDQQQPILDKGLLVKPLQAIVPISTQLSELPATDNQTLRYLTYRPPIVLRDIPALFQVIRC